MNEKRSAVIPIAITPFGFINAYLLQGARSVLVDTGYPGSDEVILEQLSGHGVDPGEVSLILITHGHTDHFGGAFELKERTGAPVAVHRLDAESLRSGGNPPLHPVGTVGRLFRSLLAERGAHEARPFEPDILIEGQMSLEEFGVEGQVIPTPGHTPGSISVMLPGGDVIVGDLIMGGMIHRRQPNLPLFADDIEQVKESIKSVMRLSPKRIFPTHGGPFDQETVLRRFSWIESG
jgi:hydroxyacylglutathione hydrolase